MTASTPIKALFDGMTAAQLRAWAKKAESAAERKSSAKASAILHTDPRLEPLQTMLTSLRKELSLNSEEILALLFKRMRSGYAIIKMSEYKKLTSANQASNQPESENVEPSPAQPAKRAATPRKTPTKTVTKRTNSRVAKKKTA